MLQIALSLQRQKQRTLFEMLAKIAQLVEHDLAKVGVAGSSPVFRSYKPDESSGFFLYPFLIFPNQVCCLNR